MDKKVLNIKKLRHIITKKQRLQEARKRILERNPQNSFEYFSTLNSVFGKDRIESRKKIILRKNYKSKF